MASGDSMFGKRKAEEKLLTVEFRDEGDTLHVRVAGKLDSTTSPEFLEQALTAATGKNVVIDMDELGYISSAGLRAILALDKGIGRGFRLSIVNARDAVKDVLDMSGFGDFLHINRPQ